VDSALGPSTTVHSPGHTNKKKKASLFINISNSAVGDSGSSTGEAKAAHHDGKRNGFVMDRRWVGFGTAHELLSSSYASRWTE
jgi:hypothetical protein